eukprot:5703889-Prymnesium_polylepis.1
MADGARYLLVLAEGDSSSWTAARDALSLVCAERAAARCSAPLSVALVPSANISWISAADWPVERPPAPVTDDDAPLEVHAVRQVDRLLADVAAGAAVELVCHTSAGSLAALAVEAAACASAAPAAVDKASMSVDASAEPFAPAASPPR